MREPKLDTIFHVALPALSRGNSNLPRSTTHYPSNVAWHAFKQWENTVDLHSSWCSLKPGSPLQQGSDSCLGLFHPRCKTLHFLLNFMMFLLAQFSSLPRSHRIGVLPFGVPVTPLNLMSHANLLVSSARSLMTMLNNVSPTTHPDVLCSLLATNQTHSLRSLPFASGSPANF